MRRTPDLVLITGAGSGIGRATARRYGRMGATVLVTDVNPDTAKETARLIEGGGGTAVAYRLDVTDADAWAALADQVRAEHGVPDLLVNNAGIAVLGAFLENSKADWDRVLAVDLDGVVNGCRTFAPLMIASAKRGHIVNVASVAAWLPGGMLASYCTSKTAVKMFSECLRIELAPHGVGVTVICPGGVATGIVGASPVIGDVGIDSARATRIQRIAGEIAATYGPLLLPPDYIARGIVRAVRHDWGVVPVRPEAWLSYGVARLSPALVRGIAGQLTAPTRIKTIGGLVSRVLPARVLPAGLG